MRLMISQSINLRGYFLSGHIITCGGGGEVSTQGGIKTSVGSYLVGEIRLIVHGHLFLVVFPRIS